MTAATVSGTSGALQRDGGGKGGGGSVGESLVRNGVTANGESKLDNLYGGGFLVGRL